MDSLILIDLDSVKEKKASLKKGASILKAILEGMQNGECKCKSKQVYLKSNYLIKSNVTTTEVTITITPLRGNSRVHNIGAKRVVAICKTDESYELIGTETGLYLSSLIGNDSIIKTTDLKIESVDMGLKTEVESTDV